MACVLLPAACSSHDDVESRNDRLELLLSGKAGPEADRNAIAERHAEFLEAAATGGRGLGDFVTMGMSYFDFDAPDPPGTSRFVRTQPYFAALANLAGKDYRTDRISVRMEGPNYANVVAFPKSAKPIITTWMRHDQAWMLERVVVNATPDAVQRTLAQATN
jgi:hypothetical protein